MSQSHLPSFTLSAHALGSLSAEARTAADTHLAGCERCRGLAAEMQADRERFAQGVFARTLPQIQARVAAPWWSLERWRTNRLAWLVPAGALAAVAVAALLVVPVRSTGPDLSIKGGPTFQVFAKRGIEVFAVREGATLKPGDQLRFAVDPGDFGHILIASVDGAHHATIYYPFDGAESGTVTPETRSELPGSVTLDATIGDEQLLAFFSKDPLPAKVFLDQLETRGKLEDVRLPYGAEAVTLGFHKAAP